MALYKVIEHLFFSELKWLYDLDALFSGSKQFLLLLKKEKVISLLLTCDGCGSNVDIVGFGNVLSGLSYLSILSCLLYKTYFGSL